MANMPMFVKNADICDTPEKTNSDVSVVQL